MSSTALTIRYIAYGLYFASFIYALALAIPALTGGKTGKSGSGAGSAKGSLSDLMSTISQWADSADEYESAPGHSRRVAELARQIGERYGLPADELEALECASLLHDVGQINNFDFINENRPLTFDEKTRLEEHPILGEQLVKQIANIGPAALWVRWHHERWDGCGYPEQLSGEMIPLPVRILSVADTFDALTHKRPYRSAMSTENAMKELQKMAGIMFDPNVIQVFMSIDSEAEIGSSLEV
jgi:HD-GYP domain-containing protein (c-di-GMP phosphodiesterase class II)